MVVLSFNQAPFRTVLYFNILIFSDLLLFIYIRLPFLTAKLLLITYINSIKKYGSTNTNLVFKKICKFYLELKKNNRKIK